MRRTGRAWTGRRSRGSVGLNLVSLMDIFTILVFFLLVNSTEVDLLPSTRALELPESVAEEKPRMTVAVMVTERDLVVEGVRVAGLDEALTGDGFERLASALAEVAAGLPGAGGEVGPEVTVMAARSLPYVVIREVMQACAEAGFGQVSFAVLQRSDHSEGGA